MNNITLRDLFKAGVHFGHKKRFWNPKMQDYIFGDRNDLHIIDLEKTMPLLDSALKYISNVAAHGGKILFVGTKRSAAEIISEQATRCEMPYVDHRWLGGMLTNYRTVRQSVKKLTDLEQKFESGSFSKLTKKEILKLHRELDRLQRGLGGIKGMGTLPDALFILDVGYEKIAVCEANKLKIPIVGVVDTNNTPEGINYVIPGNDDSIKAITLYASLVADIIINAKSKDETTEEEVTGKE